MLLQADPFSRQKNYLKKYKNLYLKNYLNFDELTQIKLATTQPVSSWVAVHVKQKAASM